MNDITPADQDRLPRNRVIHSANRTMKIYRAIPLAALALALVAGFPANPSAQDLCVKVARANLRAGPGTDQKKTWEVYKYMPLTQVERKGDWIHVRDVDGDEHWIFHTLVTPKIKCVTIKSARANIRKGPGTRYDKWFAVEKYTSFKKIGQEGKWIKVVYEGEEMWIFNNLVWPK